MNYSQAKALAKQLINERKIDHVIAFDGKNYTAEIAKGFKGNAIETIKFKVNANNPKPVKTGTAKQKRKPV